MFNSSIIFHVLFFFFICAVSIFIDFLLTPLFSWWGFRFWGSCHTKLCLIHKMKGLGFWDPNVLIVFLYGSAKSTKMATPSQIKEQTKKEKNKNEKSKKTIMFLEQQVGRIGIIIWS